MPERVANVPSAGVNSSASMAPPAIRMPLVSPPDSASGVAVNCMRASNIPPMTVKVFDTGS